MIFSDGAVGRDPIRSAVGFGFLGLTIGVIGTQWFFTSVLLQGEAFTWLALPYDAIAWSATVLVGLSFVVAVLYGAWNGGPAFAVAIAIVPILLGSALRGQLAITVDLTLALAAATCAGWTAWWRLTHDPGPIPRPRLNVGVIVGITVLAAGTLRDVTWVAAPYATPGAHVAATLFTLGIVLAGLWVYDRARNRE